MRKLHPKQISDWFDLWRILASLVSLHRLKVNLPDENSYTLDDWSQDTWWLDPVRTVTAPSDFELLMPINVVRLDLDTTPSSCRIIGHPSLSALEYSSCA